MIRSSFDEFGGGFGGGAIVDDGHEGAGHAGGVGVLDDVAAIDDAGSALLDEFLGAFEDFLIGGLAAAADEDGNLAGDLDDFVVNRDVVRGIGLDDVRAEFDGLADEREDFVEVAVHHVTAGLLVRLENERLDHERHADAVALGLDFQNVLDALVGDFGLLGNAEEIDDDASGVETKCLLDGLLDHAAEERAGKPGAINIRDIGAQDKGGLFPAGQGLEIVRLADGKLDGVRRGGDEDVDALLEVFDALEEIALVEEAVVHRDIETAVGFGVKQAVQTVTFHNLVARPRPVNHVNRAASMLNFATDSTESIAPSMHLRITAIFLAGMAMLAGGYAAGSPASAQPARPAVPGDLGGYTAGSPASGQPERNVFIGLKDFSHFTQAVGTNGEIVLISPEMTVPVNWDELVVSWNVPTNVYLTVEARAIFPDHTTKYFILDKWSVQLSLHPRESVWRQGDKDGTVSTDTLILKRHGGKAQVRITLGSPGGATVSKLEFLGLSFCDSQAHPAPRAPNHAAWGKTIDVPQRRQGEYEGGGGWCSPTSLSMVLAYWSDKLQRPELNHTVPETAAAINDAVLGGTGNWPFNTAYAGLYPGMRAYVTRLNDISELEDWIAAGVAPIVSVSSFINVNHQGGDAGHLIVCAGFTDQGDVVVNDPGVSVKRNMPARKVYERQHFIDCWKKSKNAVYLVYPIDMVIPKNVSGHWDNGN